NVVWFQRNGNNEFGVRNRWPGNGSAGSPGGIPGIGGDGGTDAGDAARTAGAAISRPPVPDPELIVAIPLEPDDVLGRRVHLPTRRKRFAVNELDDVVPRPDDAADLRLVRKDRQV